MRLHQAGMRGDDADAKAVGAAFGCGNAALVNVIAVAVCLAAVDLAPSRWDCGGRRCPLRRDTLRRAHVRIDCAQMHARADLQ